MRTLDLYDNLRHLYDGLCAIQCVSFALETNEADSATFGKGLGYIIDLVEREFRTILDELKEDMAK